MKIRNVASATSRNKTWCTKITKTEIKMNKNYINVKKTKMCTCQKHKITTSLKLKKEHKNAQQVKIVHRITFFIIVNWNLN